MCAMSIVSNRRVSLTNDEHTSLFPPELHGPDINFNISLYSHPGPPLEVVPQPLLKMGLHLCVRQLSELIDLQKRKGFFRFMVYGSLLWACGKAVQHGKSTRQSKSHGQEVKEKEKMN